MSRYGAGRAAAALIGLTLVLAPAPAVAHKPSDSYLALAVGADGVNGQWDIALRDLDYALGLDADGDGAITWGELRARHAAIAEYALARLELRADGAPCRLRPLAQVVDQHSDGGYAVLPFHADCAAAPQALEIGYRLFFDLDPQHRGLLRLTTAAGVTTAVFAPERARQRFEAAAAAAPARQLLAFGREGVWHIWLGFDHILFLLSLLLPAVLRREADGWRAASGFRPAIREVLAIVTAFTVAHSITLSLATLGVMRLPSRWVESAIAASVILAAANNLVPLVQRRRFAVAFAFGLIHGFGFASVLADLGLPQGARLVALVGFNIGVEVGQLALVALFLPLAYRLRHSWFYQRLTLTAGSSAIAAIACLWLAERALNLKLLSF